MPTYVDGVAQSLGPGQNVAVLNAENLANGDSTEAVYLPGGHPDAAPLTVINLSGQPATLEVAATNVDAAFVTWESTDGGAFVPADGEARSGAVTGGLYYRLVAGGDVTAGTLVIAR